MLRRQRTASLLFAAYLCAMQLSLFCGRALGQSFEERASRQPGSWHVDVEIVSKTARREFEAVLRDWFQINAVLAQIHRTQKLSTHDVLSDVRDQNLLRIWVTFPKPDQATLYFVEPGSQRFLLRDVSLPADFGEIAREQLVQVIVTSADAFMQRRTSTPKEDFTRALRATPENRTEIAPTPIEPPSAPQSRATPLPVTPRVGAFYQLAVEQTNAISHGPGLLLGLGHDRDHYRFFLDFAGQYLLSHTVQTGEVGVGLRGFAVRGFIGAERRWTETLAIGMKVGAGADRVSFEPFTVNGAGVKAKAGASLFRPALTLDFKGVAELASMRVALVIGCAAYLKKTQYVVLQDGVPHVVYQPFVLEPQGAIEITWN